MNFKPKYFVGYIDIHPNTKSNGLYTLSSSQFDNIIDALKYREDLQEKNAALRKLPVMAERKYDVFVLSKLT